MNKFRNGRMQFFTKIISRKSLQEVRGCIMKEPTWMSLSVVAFIRVDYNPFRIICHSSWKQVQLLLLNIVCGITIEVERERQHFPGGLKLRIRSHSLSTTGIAGIPGRGVRLIYIHRNGCLSGHRCWYQQLLLVSQSDTVFVGKFTLKTHFKFRFTIENSQQFK